ncbi:MAG TPA: LysM peptidoglycan-binding domain-containing protein [Anaerolineae bacterium]|nr:LysM peptidoglycan-binding domain-containing protein [Anaerolineae bacterium]
MLKKLLFQSLWIILITALVIPMAPAQAQGISGNLLRNGDFEEGDYLSGWAFQDNIPEVQVAPGWRAFYLDVPPAYATKPARCSEEGAGCYWARPEFRDNKAAEFAYRVQSGLKSQKYFTFGRQHEAGLMQQVTGIQPGTKLHFQVFVLLWSCMAGAQWSICPTTPYSNSPAPMHARVGIDPTGGTNPWAGTVIWAGENNTVDTWLQLQVEAVAQADKVTVFVHTRADWTDMIPRIHNDVYVDNASLVSTGIAPSATTSPSPKETITTPAKTTATATTKGKFTPAPIPAGAEVYVVVAGDSLSKIAKKSGITLAKLRELNVGRIRPNDLIIVGDKLVVGGVIPTRATTPPPAATTVAATATPAAATTPPATESGAKFKPAPIPAGSTVYVATAGDTLSAIAKKFGLTLTRLRELNVGRIRPNDSIWVGDQLVVGP